MIVSNTESIVVPGPREAVFARAVAPDEMPKIVRGWGPVPGLERVEVLDGGPLEVGKVRRIHNTDGSTLDEEILVLDPPSTHAYRLYGDFRGIAKLLVREGQGRWSFVEIADDQTEVSWRYEFTLTSALAWPLAVPMMKVAFAKMQRRSLEALRSMFA
jgi:hypothetical protein